MGLLERNSAIKRRRHLITSQRGHLRESATYKMNCIILTFSSGFIHSRPNDPMPNIYKQINKERKQNIKHLYAKVLQPNV